MLTRRGGWIAAAVSLALAAFAPTAAHAAPDIDVYRGTGAWVDIYDARLLSDPEPALDRMALEGVRTLYLETANFHNPRFGTIAHPAETAQLIDGAHQRGLRVVAWYLPSFRSVKWDLGRSLAAIGFTTPGGGRFDSFALDIESNVVRSITTRNRRALDLSRRIRAAVGPAYPLGGIVPDARSTTRFLPSMWPRFPYRRLRPLYDAFLPMGYSSYRGRGARYVFGYTRDNVAYLRLATRDPLLPVHLIGGLANKLRASEASAVVDASRATGAIGVSFYKHSLSGREEWRALRRFDAPISPARVLAREAHDQRFELSIKWRATWHHLRVACNEPRSYWPGCAHDRKGRPDRGTGFRTLRANGRPA